MEKTTTTVSPQYEESEQVACKICTGTDQVVAFKNNYICEACITYIKDSYSK